MSITYEIRTDQNHDRIEVRKLVNGVPMPTYRLCRNMAVAKRVVEEMKVADAKLAFD